VSVLDGEKVDILFDVELTEIMKYFQDFW